MTREEELIELAKTHGDKAVCDILIALLGRDKHPPAAIIGTLQHHVIPIILKLESQTNP